MLGNSAAGDRGAAESVGARGAGLRGGVLRLAEVLTIEITEDLVVGSPC